MQSSALRSFGRRRSGEARQSAFSAGWLIFLVLVVTLALGGGSSKTFVASLLFVRPVSILCLGLLLIVSIPRNWQNLRLLIALFALFAAWMVVQLVPLPPSWWSTLPGRAPFLEAAAAMGVAQPWRPLTLNVDLTLASLFALAPAGAVLVAYAGFTEAQRASTVGVVLAVAVASAALALVQLAGGENSLAYTYAPTSRDLPVGLLANRNHQATLLALGLPVLALWLRDRQRRQNSRGSAMSYGLGGLVAVLFVMVSLVSGSRAGLILCSGGIIAGSLLFTHQVRSLRPRIRWMILGGGVAALVLVVLLATAFGRALVVERLDTTGISGDQRFRAFPVLMQMAQTFFPVGTGFGTFDPVFRMFEPDSDLDRGFFNNAHNDLIELVITGGLPALLLLLGFMSWFVTRVIGALRGRSTGKAAQARGWIGVSVIILLLAASLFDYPLRTPLLSMIFALACCWVSDLRHIGKSEQTAEGS